MAQNTMKYTVRRVRTCPECKGSGWLVKGIWEAFYAEHPNSSKMTPAQINAWFREHGYESPPDEEVMCYVCGGTGEIAEEVPLQDALHELGVL